MKKIRIAVSISSRLRNNNDVSLQTIKDFFTFNDSEIEVETDYFVHFNRKKCIILNGKLSFSQDYISKEEEDMIQNIFSPKKIVIEENYDNIKIKINDVNLDKNEWIVNENLNADYHRLYQYHSFEESIKLIDSYEKENNFKYDLIFKFRPDIFTRETLVAPKKVVFDFIENYRKRYDINCSWAKSIDINKLLVNTTLEIMNGCPRICDVVYYGTSDAIKLFSNNILSHLLERYKFLKELEKTNECLSHNLFTPESFLGYLIEKHKMNVVQLEWIHFIPIRKNYNGTKDFLELAHLFHADESEELLRYKK